MELSWRILLEGSFFLVYVITCICLIKSHYSRKYTIRFCGILLGIILLLYTVLVFRGQYSAILLSLITYLPFTIGMYILTGYQLSQTLSIGMMGLIMVYELKIVNKLLHDIVTLFYYDNLLLMYNTVYILMISVVILLAGVLVLLILRFLRKPFQRYMDSAHTEGWLLLFLPMLMSYLLLSYFAGSTTEIKVLVILLLIVTSVFVMVLRIVFFQSVVVDMKESEQKMEIRLQAQRQEYEEIARKMEAGRIYRHDIRHHLLVINELAMQEDVEGIRNYIEQMSGKLAETEREFYCENVMINTMLSVCIGQAKAAGCAVSAEVHLPEKICFDEMDVCMILANALENAANACKEIGEEKERYIHITVELIDNGKLLISICNPCNNILQFGEDGLPVSNSGKDSKEHGIGLKSIRALAEKYHGFVQCKCSQGEFCLQAALFREQRKEAPVALAGGKKGLWKKQYISGVCITGALFLFLFLYSAYASPSVSEAMGNETVQDSGMRLKKHTWKIGWGGSSLNVSEPILEETDSIASALQTGPADHGEAVEEWNRQVQEYIDEMKKQFLNYYFLRNDGYVGCDVDWEILRDDEAFLSVCMKTTINAGGSKVCSRCFTLDKANGKMLALKDLFLEDSDYIGVISEEILRQMTEQIQNGKGNYYIPGGLRSQKYFKKIDEDQNFYINEENDLVIIFDEYEVTSGDMGMPQFVIDKEILADILCQTLMINEESL